MTRELLRIWRKAGFTLTLWDTFTRDSEGKTILAYRLTDHGQRIFEAADLHCSPLYAIDSDETIGALLDFLSVQRGDTDSEYFEDYTPNQLTWRDSARGEELHYIAFDWRKQCDL